VSRTRLRVIAVALLALTVTACGEAAETSDAAPGTRTISHAMGSTKVPASPQRVVVLDSAELDAAVSLGVTPVGAVSSPVEGGLLDYLADRTKDVKQVGTIAEPNLEAIAALKPDLILSSKMRHEELYDELSAIAPTVFAERTGYVWKQNLALFAEALGRADEATALLGAYEQRAAALGKSLGEPADVAVSVVRFMPGQNRLYGKQSFIGTVLEDIGVGRPQAQQAEETFVEISPEQISKADGDVVYVTTYGPDSGTAVAKVTGGPLWQRLGAVRSGDVHTVSDDLWMLGIGVTAANKVLDDLERTLPKAA
jgi:iron complex transport system substrate-binding protein